MARILLVDDHEVLRMGLSALLQRRPDFQVIGEAGSAAEALEKAVALQPDIVIMDVRLPDQSGIEACRQIRDFNQSIRVIMLTSYADDEAMFASLMAGAEGYVLKLVGSNNLLQAVEKVARGEPLLSPETYHKLMTYLSQRQEEKRKEEALTPQEQRILEAIAKGKTNKEIAEEFFLSEKTVRNHITHILSKLGLANRTQAAAFALRHHQ